VSKLTSGISLLYSQSDSFSQVDLDGGIAHRPDDAESNEIPLVNFFPRGVPRGGGGGLLLSHMTGSKARHLHGTESADVQERTSE
jgi:hypothetical protein